MKLYFARHGETDWNVAKKIQGTTDIELNENGYNQARQLAEDLSAKQADLYKIYSSKQKRAYETAKVVGDYFGVPVEKRDGLEEMNLDLWEGHTWKEVEEQFPVEFEDWFAHRRYHKAPGGEAYQDVLERLFSALDCIIAESKADNPQGKDILILSHGGVLLALMALQKDVPFEEMTSVIKIENAKTIELDAEEIVRIKGKL